MSAHQVMVLAGETSGDTLAAELINELRDEIFDMDDDMEWYNA